MKSAPGRAVVALCVIGAILSFGIYALIPTGAGGQAVGELTPAGKFLVGSSLGEERADFSGQAMVQVFTRPDAPDWPLNAACLQSDEVDQEMSVFTGVLVDEHLEPEVEASFREQGLKVIVRGLNGGYLGGLFPGFSCADLAVLLRFIRASATSPPEKSPIYARLLETPTALGRPHPVG